MVSYVVVGLGFFMLLSLNCSSPKFVFAIGLTAWIFLDTIGWTSPKYFGNIFQIPGFPLIGNLLELVNNPSRTFIAWRNKYQARMYQIRLGAKRIIIVNSFDDIEWLCSKRLTNIDYSSPIAIFSCLIFKVKVQGSQGFSLEKKLGVNTMAMILDEETKVTIKKLIQDTPEFSATPSCNMFSNVRSKLADIDMIPYIQKFAIRSTVFHICGIHLDCQTKDSSFCNEVIDTERLISKIDSFGSLIEVCFPFVSLFSLHQRNTNRLRRRREVYITTLLRRTLKKFKENNTQVIDSVIGQNLLKSSKSNSILSNFMLLETVLSVGLHYVSLYFNHCLGHFSQPYGEILQENVFKELMSKNGNNLSDCWRNLAYAFDCQYLIAIICESVRYFSAFPLCTPKTVSEHITCQEINVMRGSLVILNFYAGNHDPLKFMCPNLFLPDRWLDQNSGKMKEEIPLIHYAFGSSVLEETLAFRELYTILGRIVLLFKVKPPVGDFRMIPNPFDNNISPRGTTFDPNLFKVRLEPRFVEGTNDLYKSVMRH